MSDNELSALASGGDMSAMETLYRRHYAIMLNFGIKYYADRDFIRDCIQEVFVNCLTHPHILKNVKFVRSWLLAALRNEIYDRMKSIKPYAQLDELPLGGFSEEAFLTFNAEGLSDQDIANRKALLKAFKHLTGNQRMAVYLHYVKGMSHQEVSAFMKMNVQSSRNLLFRALSKLRYVLKAPRMFFFNIL